MRTGGEVIAWTYEEQVFNEPFEEFYKILTSGARDKGTPAPGTSGKGKGKGKNAFASATAGKEGDVKERSAMIPPHHSPRSAPSSRETEEAELKMPAPVSTPLNGVSRNGSYTITLRVTPAALARIVASS
ncbi:hypothetical protein NUW58_g4907 [Xylaria curta]|uniref:Uncharacterized protein n=1 Tax=Xylaria curta TaxID=42375 RepID=A0ACC1P4T2_9PEZI|nr:hypothetical protein NUW58_g4907 [Xylaria curta]